MTSERRKSIIVLASTLVLGVLLGLLVPGAVFKLSDRGAHGGRGRGDHDAPQKKEWFVGMINHVIRPIACNPKGSNLLQNGLRQELIPLSNMQMAKWPAYWTQ